MKTTEHTGVHLNQHENGQIVVDWWHQVLKIIVIIFGRIL